jgi:hypothetical protein
LRLGDNRGREEGDQNKRKLLYFEKKKGLFK